MEKQRRAIQLLDDKNFDEKINGKQVRLFTLKNSNGFCTQLTNYGARVVSLWIPDAWENWDDVVLGFGSIQEYIKANEKYHGATIGRYANRIANGSFQLGGKTYKLATNNGENHLHGGNHGFESQVWGVNEYTSQLLRLTYVSPHLEEGYPGNLSVQVTYRLTEENSLEINYRAVTDQPTIVNLTHHSYFNLRGEWADDLASHRLKIVAEKYTPINEHGIPTGQLAAVRETPMDFTEGKHVIEDIEKEFDQLHLAGGYDHNYLINSKNSDGNAVAVVDELISGRQMKVYTDQPGMQLYTANFLDGSDTGKSGNPYTRRNSFCLETQHYPDSPNQESFPSTILSPEEEYRSYTVYQFGLTS